MRVLGAGVPERVIDLEHGLAVRPREIQPHPLAGRQREPVLHLWGGQLLTFDLAEHDHLQLGLQRRPPRRPRRDHRFHRPCPGSSRLAQPGHGRRLHTEQIRAIEQGPRRARHPDPVLAVDDVDIADQTTLGDHHTRHRRCPPMRNQDVDLGHHRPATPGTATTSPRSCMPPTLSGYGNMRRSSTASAPAAGPTHALNIRPPAQTGRAQVRELAAPGSASRGVQDLGQRTSDRIRPTTGRIRTRAG